MKRTCLFVILCLIALVLLAGIATNQESWTKINAAIGIPFFPTLHSTCGNSEFVIPPYPREAQTDW